MTRLRGTATSRNSTAVPQRISSASFRCLGWRIAAAVPPPMSSMRSALWSIGWRKALFRIASWRRPVPPVPGRGAPDRSALTHRWLATGVPVASRTQPTLCVDDLCTERRIISVRYVRSEIHPICHTPVRTPPLKLLVAARPSIEWSPPHGQTSHLDEPFLLRDDPGAAVPGRYLFSTCVDDSLQRDYPHSQHT